MRVAALVSGGKDSCYNMIQCVAAGHEIVALANLKPQDKDELDSYMYQTVGHQGIELYAEAMDVPLFRMPTEGIAILQEQIYKPTPEDEVEDLYQLLKQVQESVNIEAVAVGAILSDYQRIRVENVCNRLGLVALAYLWRRDQGELLQEMIDCNIQAIIIKVAALGLEPSKHLGLDLTELQPHIIKMKDKYGLNICGEGGEYETFTLNCPLFVKSIIIDEFETVLHSDNAIAPVGYLNFTKFHLEEKQGMDTSLSQMDRISELEVKTWIDLIADLDEDVTETKLIRRGEADEDSIEEPLPSLTTSANASMDEESLQANNQLPTIEPEIIDEDIIDGNLEQITIEPQMRENDSGWCWIGGILGQGSNTLEATKHALSLLNNMVTGHSLAMSHIVSVSVFIKDMSEFAVLNEEYLREFSSDDPPPVRACVAVPLPASHPVALEALAHRDINRRHTMHVQGISHWAPANIGPYSQAVRMGDLIHVAGQIALVPGTMQLVEGGARKQCRLALRHVGRIVRAMDQNTQLRDVVQGICYVTDALYIPEARKEWEKRTNNAIVDYLVVSNLPKGALLEWHIWAHRHNNRFEYEETGCCIGEFRVSIRRRWNYENNVSAIVCYVSTASSNSGSLTTASGDETTQVCDPRSIQDEVLIEIISYSLGKLLRDAALDSVCYLRLFSKAGRSPSQNTIHNLFHSPTLSQFNVVHSIIPIIEMHSPHTFLSICGVRH